MIIGQENRMTIPQIDKAIERLDKLMNPGEGKKEPPARVVEEYESYKKRLTVAKNRILRYYTRAKVKFPALATKKNILTVLSFTGKNMFKAWGKGGITQSIGRGINFLKQTANAGIDFLEDNKGLIVGVGATAAVIKLSQTALGETVKNTLVTFMETNPHFAALLNVVGVTAAILAIPTIRSKIRQKTNAATIARQELKNEVLDSTMEEPEHEIMNFLDGKGELKQEHIEEVANNPELLQRFKTIVAQLPAKDPKRAQIAAIVRRAEAVVSDKVANASNDLIEQNKKHNLNIKAAAYVNKKESLLAGIETKEYSASELGLTEPDVTARDEAVADLKKLIFNNVKAQFDAKATDAEKAALYTTLTGYIKSGSTTITYDDMQRIVDIVFAKGIDNIHASLGITAIPSGDPIKVGIDNLKAKSSAYKTAYDAYLKDKAEKTQIKRDFDKAYINGGKDQELEDIITNLKAEGYTEDEIKAAIEQAGKNLEAEKIANQASND